MAAKQFPTVLRDHYLNLPLEKKRRGYNRFRTLDDVLNWSTYYTKNQERISPMRFNASQDISKYCVDQTLNATVSIWVGSMAELEIDAIVNPTNSCMKSTSGESRTIHDVAGPHLQKECDSLGECQMGSAKLSGGYMLPAKYVIHTVGFHSDDQATLKSCYISCLQTAHDNKLSSIAFPSISASKSRNLEKEAAKVAMDTVRNWLQTKNSSQTIRRVIFCISPLFVAVYESEMQVYFPVEQPSSLDSDDSAGNESVPTRKPDDIGPGVTTRRNVFLPKVSDDDSSSRIKTKPPQVGAGFQTRMSRYLDIVNDDEIPPRLQKSAPITIKTATEEELNRNGSSVPCDVTRPVFATISKFPKLLDVGKSVNLEVIETTSTGASTEPLKTTVSDESGRDIKVTATSFGDKVCIQFSPEKEGRYETSITYKGQHILDSPFFSVAKLQKKTRPDHDNKHRIPSEECFVNDDKIPPRLQKSAPITMKTATEEYKGSRLPCDVTRPMFATISKFPKLLDVGKLVNLEVIETTSTGASTEPLKTTVSDESGRDIRVTTTSFGDKVGIQFSPEKEGRYEISITYKGQHILDSPFFSVAKLQRKTRPDQDNKPHIPSQGLFGRDVPKEPPTHWTKGEQLGTGAFGNVFICYDTDTGKELVVKEMTINRKDLKAVAEIETIKNEVSLLRSFQHERIVEFYGYTESSSDRGVPIILRIFMELVPGRSIRHQIDMYGALSETVTRRYTRQILEGLVYLHHLDIIHRDIKGGNVLKDQHANIKLADFGCSKKITAGASNTAGVGTWYWMSPDMIQGQYDNKADIWSLGCTVVEMITENPPWYSVETVGEIVRKILACDHPKYKLPKTATAEMKKFLQLCFTKNPRQRSTAQELLAHPFCQKSV